MSEMSFWCWWLFSKNSIVSDSTKENTFVWNNFTREIKENVI